MPSDYMKFPFKNTSKCIHWFTNYLQKTDTHKYSAAK